MPVETYATKAQMIARFGEAALVLLTGGDGAIDDTRLDQVIADAQAEVDGYLQGVATLPLERVPDVLRLHASSIAYYYLDTDNPTEGAQMRYKQAIRFLERVQDGKAGLGLADDDEAVQPEGGIQVIQPAPRFDRDSLKGFTD